MSDMSDLESKVTEREPDIEVLPPKESHNLIEPFSLFTSKKSEFKTLIILNQPLNGINTKKLWEGTELHICGDGGANRLYDIFSTEEERSKYIPHFICGDCDSLHENVKKYYVERGTTLIIQHTQYASDIMKCISLAKIYHRSEENRSKLYQDVDDHNGLEDILNSFTPKEETIKLEMYMVGGIGGRFDQTIHSINQMYNLDITDPNIQIFFVTPTDFIFLLHRGINYVSYPSRTYFSNDPFPICGLLPLSTLSVILNSYGLKYDVTNWKSSIPGQVSSSNSICGKNGFILEASDSITLNIEVDHDVL